MQKSYYNLEEARKWKGLAHCVSEHSKFKHFSYEVLVADMLSSSISNFTKGLGEDQRYPICEPFKLLP